MVRLWREIWRVSCGGPSLRQHPTPPLGAIFQSQAPHLQRQGGDRTHPVLQILASPPCRDRILQKGRLAAPHGSLRCILLLEKPWPDPQTDFKLGACGVGTTLHPVLQVRQVPPPTEDALVRVSGLLQPQSRGQVCSWLPSAGLVPLPRETAFIWFGEPRSPRPSGLSSMVGWGRRGRRHSELGHSGSLSLRVSRLGLEQAWSAARPPPTAQPVPPPVEAFLDLSGQVPVPLPCRTCSCSGDIPNLNLWRASPGGAGGSSRD